MAKSRRQSMQPRNIIVRAVKREKPDLHRLALALIAVAEEELRQEEFIESLKEYDPAVQAQDLLGNTAARLGDHFFIVFNEARIACRLPKQARTTALQIPGASEEPLPGWVWLPHEADKSIRKKYALAALKYAAKQNATGEDSAITIHTIRRWARDELMPYPEKLNRKEWGF